MSHYRSKYNLSTRLAHDANAFRVEDKLDKWLDLGSYARLGVICQTMDEWTLFNRRVINKYLGMETIYEMEEIGMIPSDLKRMVLSPRIVAKLHQYILSQPVTKCHKSSDSIRRVLNYVKSAASLSFVTQLEHLIAGVENDLVTMCRDDIIKTETKFNVWPEEVYRYFLVVEDMMKVLEMRRQLYEKIPKRNMRSRVIQRMKDLKKRWKSEDLKVKIPSLNANIILLHDISILSFGGHEFLLPEHLLLEVINKISEMFCALLVNHFQSGVSFPDNHYEICVKFWSLLANLMSANPLRSMSGVTQETENYPFKLLKAMEGLGVALIMYQEDKLEGWDNIMLINSMWKDLMDCKVVECVKFQDHPLGKLLLSMNSPQVAELIGTVKLMGHPSIEIKLGVQQLYDRTHKDLAISLESVKRGKGILIRDMSKAFIKRFKRYPNIDMSSPELTELARQLFDTKPDLKRGYGRRLWLSLSAYDWASIKFEKNAEFDMVENQLTIIKDKALGLERSQALNMLIQDDFVDMGMKESIEFHKFLRQLWDEEHIASKNRFSQRRLKRLLDYFYYYHNNEIDEGIIDEKNLESLYAKYVSSSELDGTRFDKTKIKQKFRTRLEEKRTLLLFLISPHFTEEFQDYMNHYMNDTKWTDEVLQYLVIKLTAKELELKELGRFFGASPPYERNRRIVQETNVMQLMDDLIGDQLMTPDELGILKKLVSFRYFGSIYPNHVLFQVSFDFSRWNNNFRKESIDIPAGEILDPWFGVNLYGKTMAAFEHMLVYMREKDVSKWWEGQLGGIEGLNQATWSLIFLGGIKHALEEAGLNYQVTVKGDDVRAVIAVPKEEVEEQGGFDKTRDIIMNRIYDLCKNMGWSLNPQESFVSLTLIATSKQYQIRDCWLPAATKKAMKMMSLSNLLFPTLEDLIGSIFSCAHSACSQSTTPMPIFSAALIIASMELYRGLQDPLLSVEHIAMATMWPQVVGGPGALPLQTFFVRGENDMLSVSLALFTSILRYSTEGLRRLTINILDQKVSSTPDPQLLISDPYSISIDIPERPASVLKRLIKDKLRGWVKNVDIAYLLNNQGVQERKDFINHLFSMRPYLAKVSTSIFECSPFYLIDEVIGKFLESPTVIALFSSGQLGKITPFAVTKALEKVMLSAKRRVCYWKTQLFKHTISPPDRLLTVPLDIWLDPQVCPTSISVQVRNGCWNKRILGVSYPSLATQMIIARKEAFHKRWPTWGTESLCMSITIQSESAQNQTNYDCDLYKSSKFIKAWVGAQTATKLSFPKMTTAIKSPTLTKIMKLVTLLRATESLGENVRFTIMNVLKSLTTVPLTKVLLLRPKGEAGHFAHRLAINAFSLNTMPNYRSNISQILDISSESLIILKSDNRDRTINHAAIHFFVTILSLLPLQFSDRLPRGYPKVLAAMFHPLNSRGVQYELCPDCCAIVEDNYHITFDIPLVTNLPKFSQFKLVGCSSFEEKTLQNAILEFLRTRALDNPTVTQELIYDDHAIELASMTIIQSLLKQSQNAFAGSQIERFLRAPTGPLLDMYASMVGMSDINRISVALLRSIPSKVLYNSLFSSLMAFVVDHAAEISEDIGADSLFLTSHHNNPLGLVFDKLIKASVMQRVIEGCKLTSYISPCLSWKANDLQSGVSACNSFLKAHKLLIGRWLHGDLEIPQCQYFVSMEDEESITNTLSNLYQRRTGWLLKGLNYMRNSNSHTKYLIDLCKDAILGSYHSMQQVRTSPQFFIEFARQYPHEVKEFISSVIMSHFPGSVSLTVCCIICVLPRILREGDWMYNEYEDIITRETFCLMYFAGNNVDEISDDFNIATLQAVQHYLINRVGDVMAELIIPIFNDIAENSELWIDINNTVNDIMIETMTRWINPINSIRICYTTLEQSMRLLRTNKLVQISDEDQRRQILSDIVRARIGLRDPIDVYQLQYSRCDLGSEEYHDRIMRIPLMTAVSHFSTSYIMEETLASLATRHEYHDAPIVWIDKTDYLRCLGRHNTSICKYIEILSSMDYVGKKLKANGEAMTGLCLADGLGGVTAYLASLSPTNQIVYNSLVYDVTSGFKQTDASTGHPPTECLDPYFSRQMQYQIKWEGNTPGDLTSWDVQQDIISKCRNLNSPIDLITMDADIDWTGPEEKYFQLIRGVVNIILSVISESTVCVCKTFLIKEYSIGWFLTIIFHLFSHVHIIRPKSTRQHSTEILVLFSAPRSLTYIKGILDDLINHKIMFDYNLRVQNNIKVQVNTIHREQHNFKSTGRSTIRCNVFELFERYRVCKGYPMSINHLINWFGVELDNAYITTSTLHNILYEEVNHCIDELERPLIKSSKESGIRCKVMLPDGRVAMSGRFMIRIVSLRLTRLYTLRALLMIHPVLEEDVDSSLIPIVIERILSDIATAFRFIIREAPSMFFVCNGYLMRQDRLCVTNLSMTIRQGIHKYFSLLGTLAYYGYCTNFTDELGLLTFRLREAMLPQLHRQAGDRIFFDKILSTVDQTLHDMSGVDIRMPPATLQRLQLFPGTNDPDRPTTSTLPVIEKGVTPDYQERREEFGLQAEDQVDSVVTYRVDGE